jgi:hypothetical protein
MYAAREFVEDGGLMSYGASLPDLFRRAVTHIDKVLKGAKWRVQKGEGPGVLRRAPHTSDISRPVSRVL